MKCLISVITIIFLLTACAQRFPAISDPTKRFTTVSGVSILPPQESEWAILHMSTFQLGLGKRGRTNGESYAAVVSLFNLPRLDTEEDFIKTVQQMRAAEPTIGRFTTIIDNQVLVHDRGAVCMRYHSASEDTAAKVEGERKVMMLEMRGYICQHPKNKRIGVSREYSHRYFPGNDDSMLDVKANAFLEQVEFTDF